MRALTNCVYAAQSPRSSPAAPASPKLVLTLLLPRRLVTLPSTLARKPVASGQVSIVWAAAAARVTSWRPSTQSLRRCIRGRCISAAAQDSPDDVVREEHLSIDPAPVLVRERRLVLQPRVAIDRPRVRLRQPRIRIAEDPRGRGGPVVGQRLRAEGHDLYRLSPTEIDAST